VKTKSVLINSIPAAGFSDVDSGELLKALAKEEANDFAITANVVNLDQYADNAYVDTVRLNAAGTGNVTSFTGLSKASKNFRILNTGAGAKTITAGSNIKIVAAAATAVLAINEYAKCYNDGTTIYVESVHKFA
jgi:hypothetical protein